MEAILFTFKYEPAQRIFGPTQPNAYLKLIRHAVPLNVGFFVSDKSICNLHMIGTFERTRFGSSIRGKSILHFGTKDDDSPICSFMKMISLTSHDNNRFA